MEDKFQWFVPVDIIEKGKKDENGLPEELKVAGVASSSASGSFDADNQFLDVNGFDYTPFLKSGFLNLEHKGREDYSNIVGEPTNAYVKDNKFCIEGRLYKENPKAVAVYKLANVLKKSGSSRKIGYSIEGKATEFDPKDPRKVTKAKIYGCAITIMPKNDGTELLVKGGKVEYETQPDSEYLVDIVDNGIRYTVDKNLNIQKAIQAGETTGTDTINKELTQEPLKEESINSKKKKKQLLSKGEIFKDLIDRYNLDNDSCKKVFDLASKFEKFIFKNIS